MFERIAALPTTNLRIAVSVALAALYVFVLLVGIILGRPLDVEAFATLGVFILTMMGLDVAQYTQKRKTFQPSPPMSPDAEDAAAPPPKPEG